MEATLIFSEIVFNFVVSIAVVTAGVLLVLVALPLIRIGKELEQLSSNLNQASFDAAERINDIIDRFSELPIFSFFLKKRSQKINQKKRKIGNISSIKKM